MVKMYFKRFYNALKFKKGRKNKEAETDDRYILVKDDVNSHIQNEMDDAK